MADSGFTLTYEDPEMKMFVSKADHRTLAMWAIACTERVLHFYTEAFPEDKRPREAVRTLQKWIETGEFHMKEIRGASLASHAAAREIGEDTPARSAARAAGQAVAVAHVPAHAVGAARYTQQAIHRAARSGEAESAVEKERKWQLHSLMRLLESQEEQ